MLIFVKIVNDICEMHKCSALIENTDYEPAEISFKIKDDKSSLYKFMTKGGNKSC